MLLLLTLMFQCNIFAADQNSVAYNRIEAVSLASLPPDKSGKPHIGVAGPLTGCHGNVCIIAGGADFPDGPPWEGGKKRFHDTIFVLKKDNNGNAQWHPETFHLPQPMAYSACVSTADGVICVGGENENGLSSSVLRLKWDEKQQKIITENLPELYPVSNASAVATDQRLYVFGGVTTDGVTDQMSVYDLRPPTGTQKDGWEQLPPVPQKFSHAVAVAQSDGSETRLYLFGGRAKIDGSDATTFYQTTYSYHPRKREWQRHADMPVPLAAGCGVSSGFASALLFGGDRGTMFLENERLQTLEQNAATPEEKTQYHEQYLRNVRSFEGFPRDIFLYDTIRDQWSAFGELPFTAPVTTTTSWWDGGIVFPSGEIKPGVRTPDVHLLKISSPKGSFGFVNYGVLGVYLLGMLVLGGIFARRNETTSDFFRGGGRIPWWAIGISIFATALSSITFLSMPAKAYATDWRMLFYNAGILLVVPIVTVFYLGYFRNLKLETAYEFLERRFNYLTRAIASGLFCAFMISRIAIVLFLPSLALAIVIDINIYACILMMGIITLIYCTLGGMEAVVWGDVIQGAILVIGAIFSLVYLIVYSDGGFSGFLGTGYEMHKFHTFDFSRDMTQPLFLFVLVGGFANSLITYSSDQAIIQRYMSTQNRKQAVNSIWLNAFLSLPVTLIFFLIGTALFTYYRAHPLAIDVTLRNTDAIYPLYIVNTLPVGVSGLLVAAIFSAAMSTLSANINSASAAFTADFVKKFRPTLGVKNEMLTARLTGIIVGVCGILLAVVLASCDIRSLWDLFNTFLGLTTSVVGGLFLMGVFSKRINGIGAVTGLIGGMFVVAYIRWETNLSFLLYGVIGMLACYLFGWLASALTGFSNVKFVTASQTDDATFTSS